MDVVTNIGRKWKRNWNIEKHKREVGKTVKDAAEGRIPKIRRSGENDKGEAGIKKDK